MGRFPSIKVRSYTALIGAIAAQKQVACGYCGAENFARRDYWICYNCELGNYGTMLEMRHNDQEFERGIAQVNTFLSAGDYQNSISEYEKIAAAHKEPEFLYTLALLHIKFSNSEVARIRYDKKGFMEENAVLRDSSIKAVSKARMLLSKASLNCEEQFKAGTGNEALAFTFFMINIKLGNLKTARRALTMLDSYDNKYFTWYAHIVFNAEMIKPAETAEAALYYLDRVKAMGAIYYLAWALAKEKRSDDSAALLAELRKYVDAANVDALMQNIARSKVV